MMPRRKTRKAQTTASKLDDISEESTKSVPQKSFWERMNPYAGISRTSPDGQSLLSFDDHRNKGNELSPSKTGGNPSVRIYFEEISENETRPQKSQSSEPKANMKCKPSELRARRNKDPANVCIRCVVNGNYTKRTKENLTICIFLVTILQFVMMWTNLSSIQSGIWGIVMQVLYFRLMSIFPDVEVLSPLFISVCGESDRNPPAHPS